MRLGKKLSSTNIKYRSSLLANGLVFYTKNLEEIKFNGYSLNINGWRVGDSKEYLLDGDWYYPAETYTINGVELVDERLSYEEAVRSTSVYFSSTVSLALYNSCNSPDMQDKRYIRYLCDSSLVHLSIQAAILHTKAMMKVAT